MSMEVSIQKNLGSFKLTVSFETDKGSLGILGASGCGKSMTLKCIAGIVTPDEGRICVNGRVLFDSRRRISLKPQQRKVGYLFQDYALFPHMTTFQNIGSGLRLDKNKKKEAVARLMERFHLEGLEQLYPRELSGGQQQRAALARIVACGPEAILLDEPFSALDSYLREQVQMETADILKGYENAIMVTHNRDEAYQLCGGLLVMDAGKVLISGDTRELFKHPRVMQAAKLTGCKNISRVVRAGERTVRALDWGGLPLNTNTAVDGSVQYVGIRAHEFMPVFGDEPLDNTIRMHIISQTESPFEKHILFINADAAASGQNGIRWVYSGHLYPETPPRLRIPPENLLLLR